MSSSTMRCGNADDHDDDDDDDGGGDGGDGVPVGLSASVTPMSLPSTQQRLLRSR